MAVVQVGWFVQFRRHLGQNAPGDIQQVAEILQLDNDGDSYVRLDNGNDWYITDRDFEVLGPQIPVEFLNLDVGEVPEFEDPEEEFIQQVLALQPEYEHQSEQYSVLYKQNGNDRIHMTCYNDLENANQESDWIERNGFQVLRKVKITLGYNL